MIYFEAIFIAAYVSDINKEGYQPFYITVMLGPIIQIIIGYSSIVILGSNTNSYSMVFGAAAALLIIGAIISLLSGFIIIPLVHKAVMKFNERN